MSSGVRYISSRQTEPTESIRHEKNAMAQVVPIDELPLRHSSPIDIDQLYPEQGATSPVLATALSLLTSAIDSLAKSTIAIGRGELIESDEEAMRCQAVLPELFCCRELGDGFASVVNAVKLAFRNSGGTLFSKSQLEAMQIALGRIRAEPYLNFEIAVEIIAYLEDANLVVDPPGLDCLTGALNAEGLH